MYLPHPTDWPKKLRRADIRHLVLTRIAMAACARQKISESFILDGEITPAKQNG